MKRLSYFMLSWLLLGSCGDSGDQLKKDFMQTARGEVGEIILVMDSTQYDGQLGETIKEIFREPMRGLPQDEPLFNINKASPKRLNSILKSATNMVFVMTLDSKTSESNILRGYFTDQSLKSIQKDTSVFMATRRDEFAKGQVALFLFSQNEEILIQQLQQNKTRIQEYFEGIERTRIQDRMLKSRERDKEKAVSAKHPFSIKIPYGWDLAKNDENFVWLRFLESNREHNLFFYYEPYADAEIFNNIPQFRDKITETYLRDIEKESVYITRQQREDIIDVLSEPVRFNGNYAVKSRGLWKISDNSGGGPFISYMIVDEGQQMLYYIEGYVYAPSTKKKNFIRELDAILATFEPKKTE